MSKDRRVFQLIDFDRTLFDTALFSRHVTAEVDKLHPGLGTALQTKFEEAYKREETFYLLRYLRTHFGNEALEALVTSVVEREGAEIFLLPQARERLQFAPTISGLQPAWGILTYGDADDQWLKLKIAGMENVPVYIADTPDKGMLIRGWKNDNATFTLPAELSSEPADELTFEDDKLRAFRELPEGVTGVWITQYENDEAHQRLREIGAVNVVPAKNLFESIEHLRSNFL